MRVYACSTDLFKLSGPSLDRFVLRKCQNQSLSQLANKRTMNGNCIQTDEQVGSHIQDVPSAQPRTVCRTVCMFLGSRQPVPCRSILSACASSSAFWPCCAQLCRAAIHQAVRLNLEDSFDLHDECRRQPQKNPQPQEDGGSSLDGTVTTSE